MQTVIQSFKSCLERGIDCVLVMIVDNEGSSPRKKGTVMLVPEQLPVSGTVGGGKIEYLAIEQARKCLTARSCGTASYDLEVGNSDSIGMVCGGTVKVYYQFVDASDPAWAVLAQNICDAFASGEKAAVRVDPGKGQIRQADPNESDPPEGVYVLTFPAPSRAIVFGAGHIAVFLVPLLQQSGFTPVVFDNRPELATAERFPDAARVICGDYRKLSDHLSFSGEDYIVVLTHGHTFDFEVEEQVLRHELAYIGVIGSRRKTEFVNDRLRSAGLSEEQIGKVYTPIGLDIRAETPQEIAVSIAAEMIMERGIKNGIPEKKRNRRAE